VRAERAPSPAGERAPRTMESVADPAPALASTTSVPAFWMRSVILAASSSEKSTLGVVCACAAGDVCKHA